jgi:hypothetical protein
MVCSVISAYRLLDVITMLDGALSASSVEGCSLQVQNTNFRVSTNIHTSTALKCLQGMDKMAHWPTVLEDFWKTIDKSTRTFQLPSATQAHLTPFHLLLLIACNNTSRTYTAIEANFLYAAMHIACMKELHFTGDTCPDLPENLDDLVHR